MTGTHELCMLIDGVVKRFPTAIVKIDMPYYKGTVKALCMENPVQEHYSSRSQSLSLTTDLATC